jgi:hypothetical protein
MLYRDGFFTISRDIRVGGENLGKTVIALVDQVQTDLANCGARPFSKEELNGLRLSHILPSPLFPNRLTVLRDLRSAMKYIAEFEFDADAIKPLVDAVMLFEQCLDGTLTLQWKPQRPIDSQDIHELVELALKGLSWDGVHKALPPSSTRPSGRACQSAFHRFALHVDNFEKNLTQRRAVRISLIVQVLITPIVVPACVLIVSLLPVVLFFETF